MAQHRPSNQHWYDDYVKHFGIACQTTLIGLFIRRQVARSPQDAHANFPFQDPGRFPGYFQQAESDPSRETGGSAQGYGVKRST